MEIVGFEPTLLSFVYAAARVLVAQFVATNFCILDLGTLGAWIFFLQTNK